MPLNPSSPEQHEVCAQESGLNCDLTAALAFESLLANLSAHFVNLAPDQVDREIEEAQKKICKCLGIDHSALWENSPLEPGVITMTHMYGYSGDAAVPSRVDGDTYFPWIQQKILRKETICVANTAEVPPEASVDQSSWKTYGIRSVLSFPLWVGSGSVFGALSFADTAKPREWPESLVQRLQLLAQVIANALVHRRDEEALTENEARLRLAAASADAGLWTLDPESGRFWTTEKTNDLFGMGPKEELDYERFLAFVFPEDRQRVIDSVQEALQSSDEKKVEYRIARTDGETRWISAAGRHCPERPGESHRLMGVILDITERKRAEESQLRHSAIVQSSDDAIIFVNLEGTIADWNAASERIYGYRATEAIGQPITFIIPPELLEESAAMLNRSWTGEHTEHFETIRVTKDGRRINVSVSISPIKDSSGRLLGASKIARDITEAKRSQDDLQRSYAEVKQLKERLQAEAEYLQEEIKGGGRYDEIVGQSEALKKVLRQVDQVARTDSAVLITGESGTGKELVARAIHRESSRKDRVMVKVDCASLPATLIESELFGREKGAYTGSMARQIGRFETADGSTIFLDEIGELGMDLQAKLLRIVEYGEFERLGSSKTLHVNVRLIAATNRDLAERVKSGNFREDLFYRLNVFPIRVPSLRERPEDIPVLLTSFLREFEKKMGKKIRTLPSGIMKELQQYSWPGNIRELRNVIERAVILTSGEKLRLQPPKTASMGSWHTLKQAERQHILTALERTAWQIKGKSGAAQLLGLKPSTLYTAMRRLQIPTRHEKDAIKS
jgi:formate hydrogenlyase transcriptional activator